MVYRVYVEKKAALANEARALLENLRAFLGIESLTGLRLFNRYDLEGISRELFDYTVKTVLSEPQLDIVTDALPQGDAVFAVEYLPGQYDQRADSAAQCVQILSQGERPLVRTARVYALEGKLTDAEIAAIKQYVINPVESREASLELPETLRMEYDIPTTVRTVEGFTAMDSAALDTLRDELGLAMDLDDLTFLQRYFRDDERREPTITEIRVVDTYWSDHCRHTTFSTHIDNVEIDDPAIQAAYERYLAARVEVYGEEKAAKRPQTLMDIATIGCAAAVRLDGTVISGIRLAYSVSAPIPVRCPSAEAAALGRSATPEALPATLAAISAAVEADVQPRTSWRANRDFRMHIIRTLAERVSARGVGRAVELQEAASC